MPTATARKSVARTLQERLLLLLNESEGSVSDLARACGVDRSGLTQLLLSKSFRMPRGDTLAALAHGLNVSTDWLLGLSEERAPSARIIAQALGKKKVQDAPVEEQWSEWHRQARDEKKRYVPAYGFPNYFETPDILLHIFEPTLGRRATLQAAESAAHAEMLLHIRRDYETCWASHDVDAFCSGTGFWRGLSGTKRRKQLLHMADKLDELYPDYKLYIFDSSKVLPLPLAIFGRQRATLFCNDSYLDFTYAEHIDFFIACFNRMVRHALVQPDKAAAHIRKLADTIVR